MSSNGSEYDPSSSSSSSEGEEGHREGIVASRLLLSSGDDSNDEPPSLSPSGSSAGPPSPQRMIVTLRFNNNNNNSSSSSSGSNSNNNNNNNNNTTTLDTMNQQQLQQQNNGRAGLLRNQQRGLNGAIVTHPVGTCFSNRTEDWPRNSYHALEEYMENGGPHQDVDKTYLAGVQHGIGMGIAAHKNSQMREYETTGKLWSLPIKFEHPGTREDHIRHINDSDAMELLASMEAGNSFIRLRAQIEADAANVSDSDGEDEIESHDGTRVSVADTVPHFARSDVFNAGFPSLNPTGPGANQNPSAYDPRTGPPEGRIPGSVSWTYYNSGYSGLEPPEAFLMNEGGVCQYGRNPYNPPQTQDLQASHQMGQQSAQGFQHIPQNAQYIPQNTQYIPQNTQYIPQSAQNIPQNAQNIPQNPSLQAQQNIHRTQQPVGRQNAQLGLQQGQLPAQHRPQTYFHQVPQQTQPNVQQRPQQSRQQNPQQNPQQIQQQVQQARQQTPQQAQQQVPKRVQNTAQQSEAAKEQAGTAANTRSRKRNRTQSEQGNPQNSDQKKKHK
ncbi:hypothetical protein PFICI_08995 [Pestalotiopsis fici W106-1]|uniref:Uncharacterized protein n=1 Tax=Pestalotiopsis fici (strain W106-1 / CGMCC3.15140) TaxID=1229662 RepID=W3X165_PESFW|nr:uncharacterized protein PFICI_08995 [Pestalotiopsis fici W106-1]ETS79142.1 hypothetical protein PFICI_08995 [Pestalotiopsis fici W106-1]